MKRMRKWPVPNTPWQDFRVHVLAAEGFLALGMARDAHEQIELIDPELRLGLRVLKLRVEIYRALGKWELMAAIAGSIARVYPEDLFGWMNYADATQRAYGVEQAREILWEASRCIRDDASIPYALARYECALGRIFRASRHLHYAIKLDPKCRRIAMNDPDLLALRDEISRRR